MNGARKGVFPERTILIGMWAVYYKTAVVSFLDTIFACVVIPVTIFPYPDRTSWIGEMEVITINITTAQLRL